MEEEATTPWESLKERRGSSALGDDERVVGAASLDLFHTRELNIKSEGDGVTESDGLTLEHVLDSFCCFLGFELNKSLNSVVVLSRRFILGKDNDLFNLTIVTEDLIDNHGSDLSGSTDVVLSVEHGDEEGLGGMDRGSELVVEGVAEVDTAAIDLSISRILEEVDHLLGRLESLHFDKGLVLLTEHDDVADAAEGGNEVLDGELRNFGGDVAHVDDTSRFSDLIVAFLLLLLLLHHIVVIHIIVIVMIVVVVIIVSSVVIIVIVISSVVVSSVIVVVLRRWGRWRWHHSHHHSVVVVVSTTELLLTKTLRGRRHHELIVVVIAAVELLLLMLLHHHGSGSSIESTIVVVIVVHHSHIVVIIIQSVELLSKLTRIVHCVVCCCFFAF